MSGSIKPMPGAFEPAAPQGHSGAPGQALDSQLSAMAAEMGGDDDDADYGEIEASALPAGLREVLDAAGIEPEPGMPSVDDVPQGEEPAAPAPPPAPMPDFGQSFAMAFEPIAQAQAQQAQVNAQVAQTLAAIHQQLQSPPQAQVAPRSEQAIVDEMARLGLNPTVGGDRYLYDLGNRTEAALPEMRSALEETQAQLRQMAALMQQQTAANTVRPAVEAAFKNYDLPGEYRQVIETRAAQALAHGYSVDQAIEWGKQPYAAGLDRFKRQPAKPKRPGQFTGRGDILPPQLPPGAPAWPPANHAAIATRGNGLAPPGTRKRLPLDQQLSAMEGFLGGPRPPHRG